MKPEVPGRPTLAMVKIIIGTTIRMTVLARTREISIMRLVGATDGFVRFPFLIDGFLKGLVGGLLALFLTWGANWLIDHQGVPSCRAWSRTSAIAGRTSYAKAGCRP